MAKLGDICTISSSNAPMANDQSWLLNLDMVEQQTGEIISYNYVGNDDLNGSIIQFDTDNVLYSKLRPNLNKVVIPDRSGFATSEMLPLKPNTSILCREYLAAYLRSDSFVSWAVSKTAGAKMPRLGTKVLLNKEIPLPPLEEQHHIATILDKLTNLIAKRRAQLEKLDLLVKSRFVEMFGTLHNNKYGFNVVTLQDVSEPITDGTHQTPTYTEDTVNGYKFLSSKDVTTGKIDWSHLKYIPEELHKELHARIAPRKGDILLAKNGTTGIAAIVDRDEVFDIYVSLALIRPRGIHTFYLWAAINADETKRQFDASLKGIGVPNLHLGEIKKAKIILPPLGLQEQFASFAQQTEITKSTIQKSLETLETLKKALMQIYF